MLIERIRFPETPGIFERNAEKISKIEKGSLTAEAVSLEERPRQRQEDRRSKQERAEYEQDPNLQKEELPKEHKPLDVIA